MNIFMIIGGSLILAVSVFLIIVVLLQESKQSAFSSVVSGNNSETFLTKSGGRTKQARLKRFTKIAAFVFFILVLLLYTIDKVIQM